MPTLFLPGHVAVQRCLALSGPRVHVVTGIPAMKLGISEAGRRAGVHRKVLYRLIEKGRLSKEIQDGRPVIDLSELARLFPAAIHEPGHEPEQAGQVEQDIVQSSGQHRPGNGPENGHLVTALREQVAALQADKADLRAERDRLLGMLDRQAETVRLLTDQRERSTRAGWWSQMVSRWLP